MRQSPMSSRKRAAPGASPINPQNQTSYRAPQPAQNSQLPNSTAYTDWPQDGDFKPFPDSYDSFPQSLGAYDTNNLPYNPVLDLDSSAQHADPSAALQNTGQLVRRNANQQLARHQQSPWHTAAANDGPWEDDEDDEQLEARAMEAKREALAKKRQIPPFVQKISSFLDERRNTDLIRWSDDGRSFTVLDEDEFAKTLIPELFKHNNYASFVRQLNMYGFHKRVGLSDNSMKASENKKKTPSEYVNPYFRRGRPDLLWLIQKPRATPAKKGQDDKADDDEEADRKRGASAQVQSKPEQATSQDLVTISRNDWDTIRQEVVGLKKQNQLISNVITTLRTQNLTIHQQAAQFRQAQERFQAMHERHENSINAILTFLATFYNRSLEGQVSHNLADMFASSLSPNNQSGNIVDMTDMPHVNFDLQNLGNKTMNAPRNKRPLLLPAPAITAPSPSGNTASRFESLDTPTNTVESTSPGAPADVPEILSLINAANANSPQPMGQGNFDFDSALAHMQTADGNTPLTDAQRSDMLHRMSEDVNTSLNADLNGVANVEGATSTTMAPSPSPPPFSVPSPNLENILNQQNSLDYVQKLQQDQAKKVQNLAERLGPLSPNGLIPGISQSNIPAPNEWNLDDWLNNSYFPSDATASLDNAATDALFNDSSYSGLVDDPAGNLAGDLNAGNDDRVHSVSSRGASPATIETVDDGEADGNGRLSQNPRKRRRQN